MKKDKLFNRWINDTINQLNTIKAPEHIWENISNSILNKQSNRIQIWVSNNLMPIKMFFTSHKATTVATAIIICILLLSPLFKPQLISVEDAATLTISVDERIFIEHTKYEQKINRLYENVSNIDLLKDDERIIVHFEKLNSIDMIILNCKSALERNPYSTIVNTSIISAFQEKIETINHLINLKTRIS